ncbi:type II secretion system secretin GspD [Gilvimarinus xylanilyticus]|uniref:Type II secretion system secretin GspD n=1 Tax=Gilvimarinus xylanilyticus TaxID=2944139 RepID=A0A9X2HVU7_9GAMM|nr:type II secretion system secretin GspD [Gilvimarinus xylanilyticus]MCP8899358.1 type II secretion system secretin GspD [Gilvimarinus xylanilyticus]
MINRFKLPVSNGSKHVSQISVAVVLVLLSSCAQVSNEPVDADDADIKEQQDVNKAKSEEPVFGGTEDEQSDSPEVWLSEVYQGTDQTVSMPLATEIVPLAGDKVSLNFESTPLEDVVHGVLGDILGQEYIVDGKIPGAVTLRTQSPIARTQLMGILESMLAANGVTLVQREDGLYLVTARQSFNTTNPAYKNSKTLQPGYSNVIVPLQYIGAAQMAEILQPVAPPTAFVRVDSVRNLLVLGGMSSQLQGWLDIIDTFDVDYLAGMSVGVFPIEYTTVDEVEAALATLMATSTGDKTSPLSGLIRTASLESLGAILVVTPRKDLLAQVQTWIERLDRAPAQGAEPQLYVYAVQNTQASHLAQLISSVFGGGGGSGSSGNSGIAPGLTPSTISSGDKGESTGASRSNSNRSARSGASSYSLGDDARIVADEVNNSLLVYASGPQYRKIEGALKRLDVMPSQVLIEASIIEVRLTDRLQYGLEWYFENELGGGFSGQGNVGLSVGADGAVSAALPNFGYVFSEAMGQVQGVLSALADKDLIRVLSTPSLMVMDNQSASIQVGDSTPVLSSTTEGNYGSTQNISYRDTGVQLDVRPSVNAGGLVTMELQQSVTDNGSEGETQTPTFFERSISSKVAVRSGESVVLGGLISDSKNSKKAGLPFFSDLPVIGWMFGGTTIDDERQELLVIITPHVMKTDQDMRDVTAEMRSRMKGLEAFQQLIDDSKLVDPEI